MNKKLKAFLIATGVTMGVVGVAAGVVFYPLLALGLCVLTFFAFVFMFAYDCLA